MITAQRFDSPPTPVLRGRWQLARFTRSDLNVLLQQGVIPEDASTELLDGMIVLKDRAAIGEAVTSIGQNHRTTVVALSKLCAAIDSPTRHVETQQPLLCREDHVPEPDFMVLRGTSEEYVDIATADDAYCVVEVADSSYERDVTEKLAAYARAGIVQYVIIKLRDRAAEVYTQPNTADGSYAASEIIEEFSELSLRVGESEKFNIRLKELLPRVSAIDV